MARRGPAAGPRCGRNPATNYDELTFAGHESGALLLGIFAVSVLHNIVHLAFGVAGLLMARTFTGARGFLIGGGVITSCCGCTAW